MLPYHVEIPVNLARNMWIKVVWLFLAQFWNFHMEKIPVTLSVHYCKYNTPIMQCEAAKEPPHHIPFLCFLLHHKKRQNIYPPPNHTPATSRLHLNKESFFCRKAAAPELHWSDLCSTVSDVLVYCLEWDRRRGGDFFVLHDSQ